MPGLTSKTNQTAGTSTEGEPLRGTNEDPGDTLIAADAGGNMLVRQEDAFNAQLKVLRAILFQMQLITGVDVGDTNDLEGQG